MSFSKIGFACLLSASLGVGFNVWAAPHIEAISPATVDVSPDRVFAPLGFDDNDNSQIVLDGELGDTCYKLGPTVVRVDLDAHKIFVRQQAFYYPGGWCADVRIPYVQTVDLGILKAGQYEVLVEQPDHTMKSYTSMPVAIATTASPDDFLYAPVTDARLENGIGIFDENGHRNPSLSLNGYFSNSCMKLKEVKMIVRPNNVVEVLPIVTIDRTISCAQVTSEFNASVSLKDIAGGRYLIHIRSLNGQSINRIVDL